MIFDSSAQGGKKFILFGELQGLDTGTIVLEYNNSKQQFICDTQQLKAGQFCFTGFIDEPTEASLHGNRKSRSVSDSAFTDLFLEPGTMRVKIPSRNFKRLTMTGSRTQLELELYNKGIESVSTILNSLRDTLSRVNDAYQMEKDTVQKRLLARKMDSANLLYDVYRGQMQGIAIDFFISHPKSFVGPYHILPYLSRVSLDSLKLIYRHWSPVVQNSFMGRFVDDLLRKMESIQPGNIIDDFSATDISGKKIRLASFRTTSYVLLDFWASWCGPCRKMNPGLRKLFAKYHNSGLEIISISIDKDEKAWAQAIAQDSTGGWHQVLGQNTVVKSKNNDVIKELGISSIPVTILLNKDGVVLGTWDGQSDANENELRTLLEEQMGF